LVIEKVGDKDTKMQAKSLSEEWISSKSSRVREPDIALPVTVRIYF
jgi:hypothetical protein